MTPSLKPLRPYQQNALDQIRWAIVEGARAPMLQLPTGAGKTVVAAHMVSGALAKGNRVAFCVPALSLVDQTFERFTENGIDPADMGVMQSDHAWKRPDAMVQIATAQTLERRELPKVDLVIIDEAHSLRAVYKRWMGLPEERPLFIGLSATPWAKGLGQHFDRLLRPVSMSELMAEGALSPFKVYAPSHPDLTGVATVAGDYHEGQLAERMSKAEIVADVVSTWLSKASDRPTLCFAVNRAHAQVLALKFAEAGVPAGYIDMDTDREERERIGHQLKVGAIKVVCNVGTLTTGVDWDVRCIILARPTKSEMLFTQIIGRGLRPALGKDFAMILDHSDTHLRLGMVTDIDHDTLNDGKAPTHTSRTKDKERSIPLPRECKACAGLIAAAMRECPCCGAVSLPPTRVSTIDGELSEYTGRDRERGKSISAREMLSKQDKQEVYSQLLGYAEERSHSKGWAANSYRDIYGVWPRGVSDTWAAEPSALVRAFVKAKNIRWAKSQQNRGASHV